ncbi:MAG: murein biosynthesis integral membrane protein MurJ [Proteobacteria bacterium]|nr:murein biosynthesis integral membrane protein MurJ [Pseudomonadota bacterium]MCL2308366.1 murein biosynthesis integral membrane protein MurJ [Pseudomonadota bacterium]
MNLLKAMTTISAMTFLSRVTGLARETLKAVLFGAGAQVDAFEAAFRLPNLLRRLFAEGAFSQAFVPVLAEYQRQRGLEATQRLVSKTSGLLMLALLVISVLGVLAAPWLVYVLASGFAKTPGKVELTAMLIRIVFPYIFFVSLVSLAGAVLNVYRRFAIPAVTPVLLNLSIIGAALFLSPYVDPPILALAWGVALGGLAQLALQLYPLFKLKMLVRPSLDFKDEGVGRVLKMMLPAILGVSAAQISILISTQLAAWLGDGRISWITYADRLMEFPSALLGVALGTVLLPSLSRCHSDADSQRYSELLDWGLRLALLLALPAALALCLLAVPLISTLYQYGQFTVQDVWQTRAALLGYSIGLPALILIKILAPGFYARQDMKTPVRIAIFSIVVTQIVAVSLMFHIDHAGLTLAISVGACFNAGLLFYQLRKKGAYTPHDGWWRFIGKIAAALAVFGAALYFFVGGAELWLHASLWEKITRLLIVIAGGGAVYFAVLWCLGFRLRDFNRREEAEG